MNKNINMNIDYRLIETQFFADLFRYGITPRENFTPIMDGMIHRFSTTQDKGSEKSGAYKINFDNWPAWFIQDFRQNIKANGKFDTSGLSKDEKAEIFQTVNDPVAQQRRAVEKTEKEKHQKENEDLAVQNAWREYISTRDSCADKHPYFKLKHITAAMCGYVARIKKSYQPGDKANIGDLMIPLINLITGEFQSLQIISGTLNQNGKYQKGIYKGTHVKDAGFVLWPNKYEDSRMCESCLNLNCLESQENIRECLSRRAAEREERSKTILIFEGIATACSAYYALNSPTVAAINCGQIPNVARIMRKKNPNAKITIVADNDEAGLKAGNEAIKAGYADNMITPPVIGMDFNDFYIQKGII